MFTSAKSALMALGALAFFAPTSWADSSWTCSELESTTERYYRMFPAYMDKAYPNQPVSQLLENMSGHCFGAISITTTFSYLDEDKT